MSRLSKYKNSEKDSANREYPLLIIGAGLNGLAAAYELKKTGAEPVILDSSSQPASTVAKPTRSAPAQHPSIHLTPAGDADSKKLRCFPVSGRYGEVSGGLRNVFGRTHSS